MNMEINDKLIKIWSTIGPRATFGMAALEFSKKYEDLMIVTSDVSTSAGLDRFRKTYPEKYLDVGIAEQNMIGIAAGLSSEGFKVITTTFSPFQTARCCEQIKVNLGYMKHKVCMVGLASGLVLGTLGYTHCSIEDIGILRSIPSITIISPADSLETVKAIEASITHENSCYIRLTGSSNNPIVYNKDYNFEIGKSVKLKEGKDISIICSGAIVSECLKASEILEKKGISCEVVNMHTIKPVDKQAVIEASKKKLIVTVEEHNILGGLGSAVAESKAQIKNSPKQVFIGVNDIYDKGGEYVFLKEKHGLSSEKIIQNIQKNYK
jgi:transketolase